MGVVEPTSKFSGRYAAEAIWTAVTVNDSR